MLGSALEGNLLQLLPLFLSVNEAYLEFVVPTARESTDGPEVSPSLDHRKTDWKRKMRLCNGLFLGPLVGANLHPASPQWE